MKIEIITWLHGDVKKIENIENVEEITSYIYRMMDGINTICLLYKIKNKKYSLLEKEKYVLRPGQSYRIEED